jgi:hypothetical protein
MQISAANLLIASQQAPPAARSDGAFAAALAQEKTSFEPLAFKQVATSAQAASQVTPAKLPIAQTVSAPMGSQIDIRV